MLEEANEYDELGYCVIPIRQNGKVAAVEWKEFQECRPTLGERVAWFGNGTRHNMAVVCGAVSGDLFIKDFDDMQLAREFFVRFRQSIKTIVQTPRPGIHFWMKKVGARNSQGDKEDGRGDGGYALIPPSKIKKRPYTFVEGFGLVPPQELCEAPEELTIPEKPKLVVQEDDRLKLISRARAYMATVEPAVSGCRGHDKTLYAAGCLMQKFGLSMTEAWPLFLEWNEKCQPCWSEKDLRRKLEEVQKLKP